MSAARLPAAAACIALLALASAAGRCAGESAGEIAAEVSALCQLEVDGASQVVARKGSCATFFLAMRNSGKTDFKGRLEISACNIDYSYCNPVRKPVDLPCSASRVEPHAFCLPSWAHKAKVEVLPLESGAQPLFSKHFDVRWASPAETIVVIVEDGSESRSFLAGADPALGRLLLFHSDGRLLPDSEDGYDAVDAVFLGDFKAEYLPREKRDALAGWVERGGTAVIHATGGSGRFASPLFKALLGFVPGAPEPAGDLSLEDGSLISLPEGGTYLAPVAPGAMKPIVEAAGRPFLSRRDLGLGSVYFCSADLSGPEFAGWRDRSRFLDLCLGGSGASRTRLAAKLACEAVVDAEGSRSSTGILAATGAYAALLAAAALFTLFKPGRRAGLWLPLLALSAGIVPAILAAEIILPRGVPYTSASVLLSESGSWNTLVFERVCLAPAGAVEAELGRSAGRWMPSVGALRQEIKAEQQPAPERAEMEPLGAGSRLHLSSGVPVMLSRRFIRKHQGVSVEAGLDCSGREIAARVTVRNDSGSDVRGAYLLYGNYAGYVGNLPSGASRTVETVMSQDWQADFFRDAYFEGAGAGDSVQTGLVHLGLHRPWGRKAASFSRAGWGDFRFEGGRFTGPVILAGNVAEPPAGTGLAPEPELAGSWSLWICSCRAEFAQGAILVPGPLLDARWSPAPGSAASDGFEVGLEEVRVFKKCGVVLSLKLPFDPDSASVIEARETRIESMSSFASGRVSAYVYDWDKETWVPRPEKYPRGRLNPSEINPDTGEVRYMFEAMENAEVIPAIGVDLLAETGE